MIPQDWNVGDLAVCIDAGRRHSYCSNPLVAGAVYTVAGVTLADCSYYGPRSRGLVFKEIRTDAPDGFHASRFRKIRPDEHEACEEERCEQLLDLLRRPRVTA